MRFSVDSSLPPNRFERIGNYIKWPFTHFRRAWNQSLKKEKIALLINFFLPGMGEIIFGQWEKGGLRLLLTILFAYFMGTSGISFLNGSIALSYLSLPLISIIIIVLYLFIYFSSFRMTTYYALQKIDQKQLPLSYLKRTQKYLNKTLANYFRNLGYLYDKVEAKERRVLSLNYLVMGVNQIYHHQFLSGIFYLLSEVGFVIYMVVFGGKSLINFFNMNTYVGDHRQVLIYGVISLLLIVFFVIYYFLAQKGALNNAQLHYERKPLSNYRAEIKAINNEKFYRQSLLVPVLGAILFTVIPLLFMILLAFTNYNMAQAIGINRFEWTGFDSFRQLFDSSTNLKALVNVIEWTFIWAVLATFTCYFGGLFLAMLLQRKVIKLKPLWRSLFVISLAVPQFVSLRVMYSMFAEYGPINTLLLNWGWISSRIDFWGSVIASKTLIIFINMWVGIPYNMLLMSGLLLNIPGDYYEAAAIAGASRGQMFRKITFPYIWYMTTPVIITSFVSNINNFNVIWLLNQGGPSGQGTGGVAGGTDILITWLYRLTMYNQNTAQYNIGSAIGILMFIISATVSLAVYRRSNAYKHEEEFRK